MSQTNIESLSQLPQPSPEAIAHSLQLQKLILEQINHAGGEITFTEYMRLALYAPGLGYYSAGAQKFGSAGDFVTAPEISSLFGKAIAKQCQEILLITQGNTLFELGAGSGILAATLLLELENLSCLPDQYLILEISADLQQRQKETLQQQCPHLLSRVRWLNSWPTSPLSGVIIANEVIDAMPVHRFYLNEGKIMEYYVTAQNEKFNWHLNNPSSELLLNALQNIENNYLPNINHYSSEINLTIPAWITDLSKCLLNGVILLIDYGFPKAEYYLADRSNGTLMCHYRHRAHDNPFFWPGLQDITAHVDFTLIAEAAVSAGLSIAGFTSQASFLIGCGVIEYFQHALNNADPIEQFNLQQQLKQLTLPNEMGEIIKVIGLSSGIDTPLCGFSWQDRRFSL